MRLSLDKPEREKDKAGEIARSKLYIAERNNPTNRG
jgi:hypothetical protein